MSSKITPLTNEQQQQLRDKAKAELNRLQAISSDEQTQKLVDDFKGKFAICEIVYKVILDDHQFNKTGKHPERMQVSMTQVPHALNYAGYDFEKDLLTKLFGAEEKAGIRSVKKLRDSLTHSLNQRAIDELTTRHDELHRYMDSFINKINTFDMAV